MLQLTKQYTISALFFLVAALVLFISFYSMKVAHRIADIHAPLVSASLHIKLEITKAHLLFEELISGDPHISMINVLQHMDKAMWFDKAMLVGDSSNKGTFVPIDNQELKATLIAVNRDIVIFKGMMQERLEDRENALPGSILDEAFDMHYNLILDKANNIEYTLLNIIFEERKAQKRSNYAGFLLLCILLFSIFYYSIIQRKKELALLDSLDQLAIQDELTSLHNRRSFNKIFHRQWGYAKRMQTSIAVAMCDIDYFKLYNDGLGHLEGDACLVKVAKLMKKLPKRDMDSIARYGGEEFVFVFPATDIEGAHKIMKDMHQRLKDAQIVHPASNVSQYVTLSIGIAACVPQQGDGMEELLKASDKALYVAKEEGRNRTVLA